MKMSAKMINVIKVYVLVISAVLSAPLEKPSREMPAAPAQEVIHQDADLQDLLNLINKQTKQDNVMVHKEKVTHVENSGGHTVEVNKEEEKVVNTNTGDVIADVQQEVQKETPQGQQEPETVVKTKIDIPSKGVHETFVQETPANAPAAAGSQEPEVSGMEEFTPSDMAEYLYFTQQFDAFFTGLEKLVNQSAMSADEASGYAKAVAMEYEKIQSQEKAFYDEAYFQPAGVYPGQAYNAEAEPMMEDMQRQTRGGYQPAAAPVDDSMYLWPSPSQNMLPADQEDIIDPTEFLTALWAEAYVKDNPEAQDIVRMLYDRVSHDDNQDDMGQIRDILLETAATSINDNPLSGTLSQKSNYQEIPSGPSQLLNSPDAEEVVPAANTATDTSDVIETRKRADEVIAPVVEAEKPEVANGTSTTKESDGKPTNTNTIVKDKDPEKQ